MKGLNGMKSGHVKAGDIVRLGWPAGLGGGLFLVLETYHPNTINDLKVIPAHLRGEHWYTRSLGATVVSRSNA
jgi:hypothetical protein